MYGVIKEVDMRNLAPQSQESGNTMVKGITCGLKSSLKKGLGSGSSCSDGQSRKPLTNRNKKKNVRALPSLLQWLQTMKALNLSHWGVKITRAKLDPKRSNKAYLYSVQQLNVSCLVWGSNN
ncbi:hypothetical protein J6590_098426 [Homalodisca vitripennis]|nr:hypothetical protein J6590_098426 [Homalodisca vitripennis]